MPQKGRKTTKPLSPAAVAMTIVTGGLVAFCLCGVLLAGCSWLALGGKLSLDSLTPCCWVSLTLGCFGGGLYSALGCKSRMMAMAVGTALLCLAVWCIIGLCQNGGVSLSSLGVFGTAAVAGGGLAGLLALRR